MISYHIVWYGKRWFEVPLMETFWKMRKLVFNLICRLLKLGQKVRTESPLSLLGSGEDFELGKEAGSQAEDLLWIYT